MGFEVHPATPDRFADVHALLAPKKPGASGCWCLSYRLAPKENDALRGPDRAALAEALCGRPRAPGVLAYEDGEVVGWAALALRSELRALSAKRFPIEPGTDPIVLTCFRVRAGHGGKGVARALLAGAVAEASRQGAAVVEAYPIDTGGARVDRTQASAGVLSTFLAEGFAVVGDTGARVDGRPKVIVRRAT